MVRYLEALSRVRHIFVLLAALALQFLVAPAVQAQDLSIDDVTVTEGDSGTTSATFTVSLSTPAPAGGVTFDIGTSDASAIAGSDYVAQALTGETIPPGIDTYTFTVAVNGDTTFEPDESFFVNVTNVSGAVVTDGQGVGTITNDDANLPTASIAVAPASVLEDSGTAMV